MSSSMLVPTLSLVAVAFGCAQRSGVDAGDATSEAAIDAFPPDEPPDVQDPDIGPPPHYPLTWAVTQAGPFRVGYRSGTLTYTPLGRTAPRTIALGIWYPTLATTGPAARYFHLLTDTNAF